MVPFVVVADRVGLSPLNATALTASSLCPVTYRFRLARPLRPLRVTVHAFRRRYCPAALVPRAFGIQSIQAHHIVSLAWTQPYFTPRLRAG